jgi:hypothetical protein
MEAVQKSQTSPTLVRYAIDHPELSIAAATLWLYFIARSFIHGYLSLYFVDASWFSPSLFSFVSFAGMGMLASVLLAIVCVGTLWAAGNLGRVGLAMSSIWFVVMAIFGVAAGYAHYQEFGSWFRSVSFCLWAVLLGWSPIGNYIAFQRGRRKGLSLGRKASRLAELKGRSTASLDDGEADELARLEREVEGGIKRMKQDGLLEKLPGFYNLAVLYMLIWMVASGAETAGFLRAKRDFDNLQRLASVALVLRKTDPDAAREIESSLDRAIFTDGTATLRVHLGDKGLRFAFQAQPEGREVPVVTSARLEQLSQAARRK